MVTRKSPSSCQVRSLLRTISPWDCWAHFLQKETVTSELATNSLLKGTFLERGRSKTTQHVQHRRLRAIYLCFSEIKLFLKVCGPNIHQICHKPYSFLRGYIRENAYRNSPRNQEEPDTNLSDTIADISPMALQAVSTDTLPSPRL
jgi:hypothetical protein